MCLCENGTYLALRKRRVTPSSAVFFMRSPLTHATTRPKGRPVSGQHRSPSDIGAKSSALASPRPLFQRVWQTVSIGVCQRVDGEGYEDLLQAADARVYVAKNAGGNRVSARPAPGHVPVQRAAADLAVERTYEQLRAARCLPDRT